MRMFNGDRKVVDLSREFIDSAGAKHYAEAKIGEVENRDPFRRDLPGDSRPSASRTTSATTTSSRSAG